MVRLLAFVVGYFAAARLGLLATLGPGQVSPMWLPTGVGVAAILICGYRFWPIIALAAITEQLTRQPLGLALGLDKALEALVAAYLLRRLAGFSNSLDRVRDVVALVGIGAMLSTTVGATIGVGSLCLDNVVPWRDFISQWCVWWLGDAMGILVATPPLLIWSSRPRIELHGRTIVELGALAVSLLAACQMAFGGLFAIPAWNVPLTFLPFPVVIWAAVRFGQHGAVTASFACSLFAVAGTVSGNGPFARVSPIESMIFLQAFVAVIVTTALVLGAATSGRARVERELRRSQRRYNLATSAGEVGVWDWNLQTNEMYVDPVLKAILGYEDHEIANRVEAWRQLVHPDDAAPVTAEVDRHLEGVVPVYQVEHRVLHKDGSVRWFLVRGTATRDENDRPTRMTGTTTDITEHKMALAALRVRESALRESHAKIRDLAGQLIAAQEEERRRLSRELHDGLNQQLAALTFEIGFLRSSLPERDAQVRERLRYLQGLTTQIINDARLMSRQLHPASLEHLGLVTALRSLCAEIEKQECIRVRLSLINVPDRIPPDAALCLYRVAQEGLRNAAKHSGAREVRITLTGANRGIELYIADTGSGFDGAQVKERGGLGLVSMEERVRLLGGRFRITSQPRLGTRIAAWVPLSRQPVEALPDPLPQEHA
ncbi:MAG TPA: MASE1 domain-containing protein [Vicinamibacteria bacterium]